MAFVDQPGDGLTERDDGDDESLDDLERSRWHRPLGMTDIEAWDWELGLE